MSDFTVGYPDIFGGKNTSALNQNGIYEVRTKDNLIPMFPDIYRVNSSGLNRQQGAIAAPSPLGARLQLGDVTDPSTPTYMRFSAMGNSFGIWYGIDIGDTNGATNLYFQDTVVKIDGEAFIPARTMEMGYTNTPFVANNRAMGRAVWTDLGDEPYIVEVITPGDRLNTTPNRFVMYAFLVDAKYYGTGTSTHAGYVTGTVPTSMTALSTFSNTGSRAFGLMQMDVTNSTAGALTMAYQHDGSNTTHYKTIGANDTLTLFQFGRPVGADGSVARIQAGGAGLRYTLIYAGGF